MRSFSFLSFCLFFGLIGLFKGPEGLNKRFPASSPRVHCHETLGFLMESQRPRSKVSLWRRLLSLPERGFENSDYQFYIEELKNLEGDDFIPPNDSAEAILAFLKVSSDRLRLKNDLDPESWSRFKRGKFDGVLRRFRKRGQLESSTLEDLTAELFVAAYGPAVKWHHFFKRDLAKNKLVLRAVQEEMVTKGLLRVFKDYRMPEPILTKFTHTRWGKALMSGFFNLGVLSGLPPLYLPGLKKAKVSESLVREILENGLNEKTVVKLERELGESFLKKEAYEKLRGAYMAGVITFVTFAGIYDTYQLNKIIEEEGEDLEVAQEEAQEFIDFAEKLEEENINIFEENSYEEGQAFCEAIAECVASLDDKAMCKSLMDPDSRCKSE